MSIANPILLMLGGLFMAIPIVLHLVMQRKPKHLIFPALRFVKQRRETNRRRLQLRHWLLLLLRCLAIFVVAAALARPSTSSALIGNWLIIGVVAILLVLVILLTVLAWIDGKGRLLKGVLTATSVAGAVALIALLSVTLAKGSDLNIGDRQAPVAAVLVVDTSPRMQYRQTNQTRLEAAKKVATSLAEKMPVGSQLSVVDSRRSEPFFSADLGEALKSIDSLDTNYVTQPLVSTLEKSVRLVQDTEYQRKEVYVVTDMSAAAWAGDSRGTLKKRLEQADDVTVYVIDVGVREPENYSLGQLRLDAESIPVSGDLHLTTQLRRLGSSGERTIELRLEKPDLTKPVMLDGKLQLPSQAWLRKTTTKLDADSAQQIEFYLGGLEPGVHQGQVRIVEEDGLAVDNQRYFAIEVREAWPILVVNPQGGTHTFLTESLAPYELRQTGKSRYDCQVIEADQLALTDLTNYAAVAILDPGPLSPAVWQHLVDYVTGGGGLAVFLGHNAQADDSFNGQIAQQLLGGKLADLVARTGGELYLATPTTFDHPVNAEFRSFGSSVPWRAHPIHRHWVFAEQAEPSTVVFRYGNTRPALVERQVGRGRAFTMTTPISDPSNPLGRRAWNELPLGNAWPYFVLMNKIFSYLVASGDTRLNYLVGQSAALGNDESEFPDKYTLFFPAGIPQPVQSKEKRVVISATTRPGAYRLRGSRDGAVVRGFSVNVPTEETDLTPTNSKRLDEVLGADRYQFARDQNEIKRGQGEARLGREFYPMLVAVLVVILAMELLMANRFYRKEP